MPLIEILNHFQEKYNYRFTYADDVIDNIYIATPPKNLSQKESINYLRKNTRLTFQLLKNNFIAINAKDLSYYICGYIFDIETNTPLAGATISGIYNYTTTDADGYFDLKINKESENIEIRFLGFKPLTKLSSTFKKDDCLNIYLEPEVEILSEIVLRNYIAKGIDKISNGTTTINFSNFGILPGLIETDVLQTVQALPGIQSINETVSDINIRGGTNDQNLILWDGIKVYQSGHFFGLISIFSPSITKDVSIIKNGTSVDYTNGVSGTIAMKSDTEINKKFIGSISSNFINIEGFVDIPINNNSSLQFSTRKAINNLVVTPTYTNYFDRILQNTEVNNDSNSNIVFDFYDASLRWLYNISDKDQIRFNFLVVKNKLLFNETAIINQNEESKESGLNQTSYIGGLFYKRIWNPKLTTTLQVYETDYLLDGKNSNIIDQQLLKQENRVSETSLKLNSLYRYNDRLLFLNGYEFIETGITNLTDFDKPPFLDKVTKVIREHALFSQINYKSESKNTKIKAGVRYNYIEKFNKHIIEPRLSINQKINQHLSIEALGEFKHQNTFQIINFQKDFLGIEKRRWFLSNGKDIPIAMSKQASLGLSYNNNGWLINVDGYYKEVDGITSQSQGFLNQYIFEKENGSYTVKGIELLVNKRFKRFSSWLSYMYAHNEYTFNNFVEINFPNNLDITHSLTFGSSYLINNFKISAGLNWHSGKPTTIPVIGNEIRNGKINYDPANSSNLNEYMRVDASATYKFNISKKIKVQTGISIWNGLNKKNVINNYYKLDNNKTQEITNYALPLTTNVLFKILF